MTSENPGAGTRAIIDTVRELMEPHPFHIGEDGVVALAKGLELHSLKRFVDERRKHPERRKGTAELTKLDSFIEHVKRFRDNQSVIFAKDDRKAPELLAVYDYHEPGLVVVYEDESDEELERREGVPRFGEHRARYKFPLSDEWKAWVGLQDTGLVSQDDFASFLEDHIEDVLPTDQHSDAVIDWGAANALHLAGPDKLRDLARGLHINVERKVAQISDRRTGEAKIHFEETHAAEGGGPVAIPGGFAIAVSVFKGEDSYRVPVRLRYRLRGREIQWAVAMHRIDRVFDVAFNESVEKVRGYTGLPVLYGAPER